MRIDLFRFIIFIQNTSDLLVISLLNFLIIPTKYISHLLLHLRYEFLEIIFMLLHQRYYLISL